LLSGKRPFPNANSQILRRHTLEYRYNITGPAWENVSDTAKDLVRKLLVNRVDRLTAKEAFEHPWFSSLSGQDSEVNQIINKSFQNCKGQDIQRCMKDADGGAEKMKANLNVNAQCRSLRDRLFHRKI
jgi:serine/threonine protein kinase